MIKMEDTERGCRGVRGYIEKTHWGNTEVTEKGRIEGIQKSQRKGTERACRTRGLKEMTEQAEDTERSKKRQTDILETTKTSD